MKQGEAGKLKVELPDLMDGISYNSSRHAAVLSALDGDFVPGSREVGVQTDQIARSARDKNLEAQQRQSCFFKCKLW